MDLPPNTRFGPYEILSRLGAGGMGVVYRAHDSRLGRDVAIKVLPAHFSSDPERLRRFEQEARATGILNHPNILAIFDVGTQDGAPFLVSELLEGETLRDRLASGPLKAKKAIDYAVQIARGLAAAHQKGLVHRDLKPENLFLTTDGRAKILDFGLAKLLEQRDLGGDSATAPQADHTRSGAILGTAGYMSPEQARGNPVDHRSDIFVFGAILYEMVSGRRAFRHDSLVETLHAILKDEPPDLAESGIEVTPGIEAVIRRCLEKKPEDRFQSAQDLAFHLEALGDRSLVSSVKQAPQARPRPMILPLGLLVAAFAAMGLFFGAKKIQSGYRPQNAIPKFTRLTFRQGNVTNARFAPDGQTVVYSAGWGGTPVEIYTTRVDSPESRRLGFPSVGLFSVSGSGKLALALGCELNWGRCRGMLAESALGGGAAREILEGVDSADWSPDGTQLAVVRPVEGRYRLEYPIGKVLYQTNGWITDAKVSPRGDAIAFCHHPVLGSSAGSIDVIDTKGGAKRTLSSGWKGLLRVAWNPSGDEVWFAGRRSTGIDRIFAVSLEGKEREVVAAPGYIEILDFARDGRILGLSSTIRTRMDFGSLDRREGDRELSWFDWSTAADLSADGKMLLFYEWGEASGNAPSVYVRKSDGSDAVRLGEGKALSLSPDGKWALALESAPQHLVLLPTGAGLKRDVQLPAITELYSASFFPDGDRLLVVGEGSGRLPRSYIYDLRTDIARPVSEPGVAAALISPDGEQLAAYAPDGVFAIIPLRGGPLVPVRGMRPGERLLQWSSDPRFLFIRGASDSSVDIDRLDYKTGQREVWKHLKPVDPVGQIGIEGVVCLTPDGKSYAFTHWKAIGDLYVIENVR